MIRGLLKHPIASLVLVAGVAVAGVLFYRHLTSPQAVYERVLGYVEKGQYDKIWDHLDKSSRDTVMTGARFLNMVKADQSEEDPSEQGRDLFVKGCETARSLGGEPQNHRVTSVSIDGDRATLKVVKGDDASGNEITVSMVKEDGAWKIPLPSLGRSMIPGLSF